MIRAEIEVPHSVMVPRGRKSVTLEVVCRLHNDGEHSAVLASQEGQEDYFWHLLSDAQREVDRSKPSKAAETVSTEMVAAGASYAQPQRLTLNAAKLRHGRTYHLRMRVMGRTAEAEFTVFRQGALKKKKAKKAKKAKKTKKGKQAAPKKKKQAAKKKARKKTARKTPAGKTARKKTKGKKKTAKRQPKKATKTRKTKKS